MIEFARQEDAAALVRKTLCSCFLAVDGTITLRQETVPYAAKAVTACLTSHGLLEIGADAISVEKVIYAFVRPNGERSASVSVRADVVAGYICEAMRGNALAA